MRSAAARLAGWIRRHALIVALATIGLVLIAGVAWFVVSRTRAPTVAEHGHQAYVAAQQHVHLLEARAQLAVVANALTADRPSGEVASRVQGIRDDLSAAVQMDTAVGRAWPDIVSGFDEVVAQIRREDSGAVDTVQRLRALLAEAGGAS